MAWLIVALPTVVGMLAIRFSFLRWATVARVPDLRHELVALARDAPQTARELARAEGFFSPWAADVLGAPDDEHAVAALNEHLSDLDRTLRVGATVPAAAGRVAMLTGSAAALTTLGREFASGSGVLERLGPVLVCSAAGALGMFACFALGRSTARHASARRQAGEALARHLLAIRRTDRVGTCHPGGSVVDPEPERS